MLPVKCAFVKTIVPFASPCAVSEPCIEPALTPFMDCSELAKGTPRAKSREGQKTICDNLEAAEAR